MAKNAIKGLIPALKEKKRYVVFEVLSEKPMKDRKSAGKAIIYSYLSLYGESGLADAGLMPLPDFDEENQRGMIRASTKSASQLRTAMMLVRQINNVSVAIRTAGISGILKKARAYLAA